MGFSGYFFGMAIVGIEGRRSRLGGGWLGGRHGSSRKLGEGGITTGGIAVGKYFSLISFVFVTH